MKYNETQENKKKWNIFWLGQILDNIYPSEQIPDRTIPLLSTTRPDNSPTLILKVLSIHNTKSKSRGIVHIGDVRLRNCPVGELALGEMSA